MTLLICRKMPAGWIGSLVLVGMWVWFSLAALAQGATPAASVDEALRNLAAHADVAFAGRVVEIHRDGGAVAVVFSVEQSILGDAGASYTLREWAGLWPMGQGRYWLGERAVIFLHPAGKAGFASPVNGMEGILPIEQESAASAPVVDVRRVAAGVQRAMGVPVAEEENGAMLLSEAKEVVRLWNQPVRILPVRRPLPIGVAPIGIVKQPGYGWKPIETVGMRLGQ